MSVEVKDVREKMAVALELAEAAIGMHRQSLRRRHPDESPEEIQQRLSAWLVTRPGAEEGDAVGRPRLRTERRR